MFYLPRIVMAFVFFSLIFYSHTYAAFANSSSQKTTKKMRVFKVALYSFIPPSKWSLKRDPKTGRHEIDKDTGHPKLARDFTGLIKKLQNGFMKIAPDVKLEIHFPEWGFYDTEKLKIWLKDKMTSKQGYHLVEIDNVMLKQVVNQNWIQPWNSNIINKSDYFNAGFSSSMVGKKLYGIPHWLCGHFIFSRSKEVVNAKTSKDLIKALKNLNTPIPNLVGTFNGSWNLPALFIDSFVDSLGGISIATPNSVLTLLNNSISIDNIRSLMNECSLNGKNPCTDETYKDNDLAAVLFAKKKADAFFGYSERLYAMSYYGNSLKGILVRSAPFGNGSKPVLFTDSFVKRYDCDKWCKSTATKFVKFMNSQDTFNYILMGKDMGSHPVIRYLLPATKSAFASKGIADDELYKMLLKEIQSAVAFPNSFSIIKSKFSKLIKKLIFQ